MGTPLQPSATSSTTLGSGIPDSDKSFGKIADKCFNSAISAGTTVAKGSLQYVPTENFGKTWLGTATTLLTVTSPFIIAPLLAAGTAKTLFDGAKGFFGSQTSDKTNILSEKDYAKLESKLNASELIVTTLSDVHGRQQENAKADSMEAIVKLITSNNHQIEQLKEKKEKHPDKAEAIESQIAQLQNKNDDLENRKTQLMYAQKEKVMTQNEGFVHNFAHFEGNVNNGSNEVSQQYETAKKEYFDGIETLVHSNIAIISKLTDEKRTHPERAPEIDKKIKELDEKNLALTKRADTTRLILDSYNYYSNEARELQEGANKAMEEDESAEDDSDLAKLDSINEGLTTELAEDLLHSEEDLMPIGRFNTGDIPETNESEKSPQLQQAEKLFDAHKKNMEEMKVKYNASNDPAERNRLEAEFKSEQKECHEAYVLIKEAREIEKKPMKDEENQEYITTAIFSEIADK